MAKSPYKALNLERDKLGIIIEEYCKNSYDDFTFSGMELINEPNQQYRAEIYSNGKKIVLDFYYVSDGTTTIRPTGKEIAIGSNIADFIKSRASISDATVLSNAIKNFKDDHMELLKEYLASLKDVCIIHTDCREGEYTLLKYKSPYQDEITIKYYANHTFQIQGRPLYLYGQISSFLSEYLPFEETLTQNEVFYSVTLKEDEILSDTKNLIPKASTIFDQDIFKNLLGTSVSHLKININFPEFSCMVMPVLKGLDWYIRKLFDDKGIWVDRNFEQFDYDKSAKQYVLKDFVRSIINCPTACSAIEECYNYYSRERHTLSHVNLEVGMSRMIETREEAVDIIKRTFSLIERTYLKIYP